MRGLVVGHNHNATAAIGQALMADGFHVTWLHVVHLPPLPPPLSTDCDAVVFDCSSNGCHVEPLLRQVRAQGIQLPILVIARHGPNWTGWLDAGADDYVPAPFKIPVVLARLRALLRLCRRVQNVGGASARRLLQVGDLIFDPDTSIARRGGKVIELTPLPARLLKHLMIHKDKTCSREDLLQHVFGYAKDHNSNVVQVHISHLRKEIHVLSGRRLIHAVRGTGYRMSAEG